MIKKEELLNMLEDAKVAEEKAIPIYTRHLSSAVFWTGLEEERVKRMKILLNQLSKESQGHIKVVEYLIDLVKKENQDAF
jgi:hypothetical protein